MKKIKKIESKELTINFNEEKLEDKIIHGEYIAKGEKLQFFPGVRKALMSIPKYSIIRSRKFKKEIKNEQA